MEKGLLMRCLHKLFLLGQLLVCGTLAGCGANMTTYVPPTQYLVASEFYTASFPDSPEVTKKNVVRAMLNFSWLHNGDPELIFAGSAEDARMYVDCGKILQHSPTPSGHMEYASPKIHFMGMGTGSSDQLETNLDVHVRIDIEGNAEGSKVIVTVEYKLNRNHVERRSIFGLENRPPDKNTTIAFTSLKQGESLDGTLCQSKLTLEKAIIDGIRIAQSEQK